MKSIYFIGAKILVAIPSESDQKCLPYVLENLLERQSQMRIKPIRATRNHCVACGYSQEQKEFKKRSFIFKVEIINVVNVAKRQFWGMF